MCMKTYGGFPIYYLLNDPEIGTSELVSTVLRKPVPMMSFLAIGGSYLD